VAGLALLALTLRLVYVWQVKDASLVAPEELDPEFYFSWASEIAGGNWLGRGAFVQSPLYAYLLGVFMMIAGTGVGRILAAQSLVGCGTVLLTYLVARRVLDRRRGLLAGLLVALYGPFIFYEGMVMKTFLSPFLTILLAYALDRATESASTGARGRSAAWRFALAGGVFGLLALDRDNFILLAPVLAGLVLHLGGGAGRKGLKAAAAFTVAAALVIAPVTIRNYAVSAEFVLLTTGGGEVFFIGNNADATGLYTPPPFVRPEPRHEHDDFVQRASEISGRPLTPMGSSWFWFREGMKYIVSEPAGWAGLLWQKTIHFWNAYELPDNLDYLLMQKFSALLRSLNPSFPAAGMPTLSLPGGGSWLPVRIHFFSTFGTVAPLGLLGLYLTRRRWRRLLPLYVLLFGYFGTVLLFFNFSRFRVPVVPILAVFAAESLAALGRFLGRLLELALAYARRSGEMREKALALRPRASQAVAAALFVFLLLGTNVEYPRGVVPQIEQSLVLGNAYYAQGDSEKALQAYFNAVILLGEAPEGPVGEELMRSAFGPGVSRQALQKVLEAEAIAKGPQFGGIHTGVHHGLGIALLQQAQTLLGKGDRLRALPLVDRAIAQFNEALRITPSYLLSQRKMAQAYRLKGDAPAAIEWLRKAIDLWPEDPQARLEIAELLYQSGDYVPALKHLEMAYAYSPDLDPARLAQIHFNRGLILLNGMNEPGKALYNLERALEIKPDYAQAEEIKRTILDIKMQGYLSIEDEALHRPPAGAPPNPSGR
jgi:tetratricopeptide (TPR) repeat protein